MKTKNLHFDKKKTTREKQIPLFLRHLCVIITSVQ